MSGTVLSVPARQGARAVAALVLLALLPAANAAAKPGSAPTPAPRLSDTGLYSDIASRTIAPGNLAYAPQYPLWSDGAVKHRWIRLPAGTAIDASDPDAWKFPAGTKVWKEFAFGGRRVETRLMKALGGGRWQFATYLWNADETNAFLAPASGVPGVADLGGGKRHDIPSVTDCRACHDGRRTEVLGFSALQLSSDRDPAVPHAERLEPGMITLDTLIETKRIRHAPKDWARSPPRIEGRTPTERAALGYLHANCGSCHNPGGDLDNRGVLLRHPLGARPPDVPAVRTTVGRRGTWSIPGERTDNSWLVHPGDPSHSAVAFRMGTREPSDQMPPLATQLVDVEAVELVRRWIRNDLVVEEGP